MAKKRKKAKKHGKKKSHKGGHIPLPILKRRLTKLENIVKKRGG
jgi:hypothetical protein